MNNNSILENYTIVHMSYSDFRDKVASFQKALFADIFRYSPFDAMSQIEVDLYKRLRSNMGKPYELNVVVYDQDKLVGWSVGVQESAETYYMMNSGVMPAYQRKGIYTAMLRYVQREVRKKGFQKISTTRSPQRAVSRTRLSIACVHAHQ